jgi:hypothetical protein
LPRRHQIWWRLGSQWKPERLAMIAKRITLEEVPGRIDDMLAGMSIGRVVIQLQAEETKAAT